jgi:hypothetical protein
VALVTPARVLGEAGCVAPSILSFSAATPALETPGEVRLSWRTSGAEGVRLSVDGEWREANGDATLSINESGTVSLTASNACGEERKTVRIAVGPPGISAVQVPGAAEPAQGRPGELAQFALENVSDPGRITAIVFTGPGGQTAEAEIERTDGEGRVYALVPYLWVDGAERYVQGGVTVAVERDDGRVGEPRPFRILPLQAAPNALADFRGMLNSLKEMSAAVDAELRKQGLARLAEAQRGGAAVAAAALEKLAADIGATGRGTLFYSTATTGDDAVSTTLTARDIEEFMAYEANVREANRQVRIGQPQASGAGKDGSRSADSTRDAGTCIAAKEPFIPFCKALDFRKQLEAAAADRAAEYVKQFADGIPPNLEQRGEKAVRDWVKTRLAKITIFGLTKRLQGYLTYLNLICLVRPIELDDFYLTTQMPRRSSSSSLKEVMYSHYDNQPTLIQVNALLVPHYDANRIRDELSKKEAKYVAKQLAKLKIPSQLTEWIMRSLQQLGQDDAELKAIEAAAKALNFKPNQPYQVGKCDLRSFFPSTGLKETRKSAVRIAPGFVQGEDNFYYLGRKINAKATMCIEPYEANFIFSDRVLARGTNATRSGCPFNDQVVTRGTRAAGDATFPAPGFSDDVHVGPSEGLLRAGAWTGASNNFTSARPAGYNPTLTEVVEDAPWVREYRSGNAVARVSIRKVGRNKWEIEGSADGEFIMLTETDVLNYTANMALNTSLAIPETRSGSYTLKLESSAEAVSGVCGLSVGAYSAPKTEGGDNSINGFVSAASPRALKYSVEAKDQPGPAGINLNLFAYTSSESRKVACRGKGTIELILPEE